MLVGPFPNANNAGFEAVYPPEKEIDFAKQYEGKGGPVAWKKMDFKDGNINNLAVFGKPELNTDAACYVAREIRPRARRRSAFAGSDDGLALCSSTRGACAC